MDLDSAQRTRQYHNKSAYLQVPDFTIAIHECCIINGDLIQDTRMITLEIVEIGSHFLYPNNQNLKCAIFRDLGNQYYLGYCNLEEKKARITWR